MVISYLVYSVQNTLSKLSDGNFFYNLVAALQILIFNRCFVITRNCQ